MAGGNMLVSHFYEGIDDDDDFDDGIDDCKDYRLHRCNASDH